MFQPLLNTAAGVAGAPQRIFVVRATEETFTMGYVFVRTGVFKNFAATMAGLPIAKEIVDLLVKTYHVDTQLMVPAWSGCASRVSWVMSTATLNEFYQRLGSIQTDQKYIDTVKRLSEHVEGPLSRDRIWREVPTAGSGKDLVGRFTMIRSLAFKNMVMAAAGLPLLKELGDYVGKTSGSASRLYVPVASGGVTKAMIVRASDDLDGLQAGMERSMGDDKFRAMLQRLAEYVEGSRTKDALWRPVQ